MCGKPLGGEGVVEVCSVVVPDPTQMDLPLKSASERTPLAAFTIKPCPSWNTTGQRSHCPHSIAAEGVGGVARQQIDLARSQGREPLGRG